jgi:hypothetical protein
VRCGDIGRIKRERRWRVSNLQVVTLKLKDGRVGVFRGCKFIGREEMGKINKDDVKVTLHEPGIDIDYDLKYKKKA